MAETCPHCGKQLGSAPHKIGGPECLPLMSEEKQVSALECRPAKQDRGDLVIQGLSQKKKTLD